VAAKVTLAVETAGKPWPDFPALLADLAAGNNPALEFSEKEREEIHAVIDKVARLGAAPRELDSYFRWAPRVGCYSFDWHRITARRNSTPSA
jgi:hypothetical protein